MSEIIDRVAAAILTAASNMDCYDDIAVRKDQFALARAAIEAMREPTEEMGRSFVEHFNATPKKPEDVSVFSMWRAMIDAALK